MRKIAICDNEKHIVDSIAEQLERIYPKEFIIVKYVSDKQLIYDIEDEMLSGVEIIIMDISMGEGPDEEGIYSAIRIRSILPEVKVIFLTGYLTQSKYIFRGIQPDGFLLKPVTDVDVKEAMDEVLKNIGRTQDIRGAFMLKNKGIIQYIPYREILYVESRARKIQIYTAGQVYEQYMKLDEFCENSGKSFLRCHQSYAVNIHHIEKITQDYIFLYSGQKIRVSKGRYRQVQEELLLYMREK